MDEKANYMGNYQRGTPYSNFYNPGYARHPNLSYSNTNTLNPLLPNPQQQTQQQQQQQQQIKPSGFEETMTNFIKMTLTNFVEIKKSRKAEGRIMRVQ